MSVIAQVESAGLNDVQAFAVRVADELAAAASTALVVLGDRLGMYRSMTGAGALSPPEMAARVGCAERYVREWLANQAAGGYVVFDPDSGRFMLPDAHAAVLAEEGGPAFLLGSAQATAALYAGLDRLAAAFRSGAGIAWDEQPEDLHEGCARLSRVAIEPYLPGWIAAISGIAARLAAGGRIADFGCGRGSAALLLARTFPAARVVGVDSSPRSIAQAREAAHAAGLDERVSFHLRAAEGWRETPVDLVCLLDARHDAGDPVGVARAARMALAPHGALLLVEPAAGDRLEDNLHAVGRGYLYGWLRRTHNTYETVDKHDPYAYELNPVLPMPGEMFRDIARLVPGPTGHTLLGRDGSVVARAEQWADPRTDEQNVVSSSGARVTVQRTTLLHYLENTGTNLIVGPDWPTSTRPRHRRVPATPQPPPPHRRPRTRRLQLTRSRHSASASSPSSATHEPTTPSPAGSRTTQPGSSRRQNKRKPHAIQRPTTAQRRHAQRCSNFGPPVGMADRLAAS